MDPQSERVGRAGRLYRLAFGTALVLLTAALAGGFARVARHESALPDLIQDPLRDAHRLADRGEKDNARQEYLSALLVNRGDDRLYLQAGVGLRKTGHHADAITTLRGAMAIRPRASTYAQLGWTLMEGGRLDEAMTAFEAALRIEPGESLALAGIGEVWLSRERYPEAAAAFERAIAAGPATARTLNSYGITLALGGRPGDAIAAFEGAVRLSPAPEIAANLARAREAARR